MSYRYFTSSSPPFLQSANNTFVSEFQANLTDQFSTAPDVFIIQEEKTFASNVYSDITVRINTAIQSPIGVKLGDDFKSLLFSDLNQDTSLGKKYYFSNNYWLCVFTEAIKNLAAGCTIRRLNNSLRWVDDTGAIQNEACAIEYELVRPRDALGTENPVLPEGYIKIFCQLNERTKKIKANQRFLFGPVENRICLKVFGEGVNNFLNQKTFDDSTGRVLVLQVGGNVVNPSADDIVNGIADRYIDVDTSASSVGNLSFVMTPNNSHLLQGVDQIYDVHYYSGSTVISGSFVFSVSGNQVPVANYAFGQVGDNTFELFNAEAYNDHTLDILCSGSSGSTIMNIELRGEW